MTKKIANFFAATPNLRLEFVVVTPAMATEWLGRNFERNRTINNAAVARFATEMKAGRWSATHQGIAFDEHGFLIDGQHRLRAVVMAGVPVQMLVASYTTASPLDALDRGTTRNVGAVLEIGGVVGKGRGQSVAAVCNMLENLLSGRRDRALSTDAIRHVYETHREGIDFAAGLTRAGRLASAFSAVAAYTFPISPPRIESLFNQAINNDQPAMYSGAWHLNKLMRQKGASNSHDTRLATAQAALKCVLLHMKGREVKLLKVSVEGSMEGLNWAQAEREKLGLPVGSKMEAP